MNSKLIKMENESGYLELIIGPMFAGKSTELMRVINMYKILNKNILIINHSLNSRYECDNSVIVTHDQKKIKNCHVCNELSSITDTFINDFDVVIIEELQFFNDAFENVIRYVDKLKKHVIVASLDGDFNREPFGDVLKLIPHCDNIKKLKALCKKCNNGNEALFSKRIVNNGDKTLIGAGECYEAVCRFHYFND